MVSTIVIANYLCHGSQTQFIRVRKAKAVVNCTTLYLASMEQELLINTV